MSKKIGFLLPNIHLGSSTKLWKALSDRARGDSDTALYIFPGGRLDCPDLGEYLENDVYSLADRENLDSAIIWSSALTGARDENSVREFVERKKNEGLPVVSLGVICPGIPSVDFDAYRGISDAIDHLVRVHGDRRIAFLRGPEVHPSAGVRFRAYKDSLKRNGIEYDASLVSSPYPWAKGGDAMRELCERRGLAPGVDFTALVASSDLMLFWAEKYLESLDIAIPLRLRATGFNDSDEAEIMSTAPTTVRMPISTLVERSYDIASALANGEAHDSVAEYVPCSLIIRESCGCRSKIDYLEDYKLFLEKLKLAVNDKQAFDEIEKLLEGLLTEGWSVLSEDGNERISQAIYSYYQAGGNPIVLKDAMLQIGHIRRAGALSDEEINEIVSLAITLYSRFNAIKRFSAKSIAGKISRWKTELLAISSYNELTDVSEKWLSAVGIDKLFVVLSGEHSKYVAGYSGSRKIYGGFTFPSARLIAEEMEDEIKSGVFFVLPLVNDSQNIGYVLISSASLGGEIIEDIRTTISSALKGIRLLLLSEEKSEKAEEQERMATIFYSRLSEDLREPLEAIRDIVKAGGRVDSASIRDHISKAGHLLDLLLAEHGEVELRESFIPLSRLVEAIRELGFASVTAPAVLPSITIDETVFLKIVEILSSYPRRRNEEPEIILSLRSTSISLVFKGKEDRWNINALEKDSSLLLAERLILLLSGSFSFAYKAVNVEFPFASLDGKKRLTSPNGLITYLGSESSMPEDLKRLGAVCTEGNDFNKDFTLPPGTVAIAYSVGTLDTEALRFIKLLSGHVSYKKLPLLVFGEAEEKLSLSSELEGLTDKRERGAIISYGPFPEALNRLKDFAEVKEIESIEAIKRISASELVVLTERSAGDVIMLREIRALSRTPILFVKDVFSKAEIEKLSEIPNVMLINTSIMEASDFMTRLISVLAGEALLPALTSALVKRAIAYLNDNAGKPISRWQLAAAVNISEDYLTRIFRKELGLSPWDYLNRYRIQLACDRLTHTGSSISVVAAETGFQDQAYFCRVFKKVKGVSPGHYRQR